KPLPGQVVPITLQDLIFDYPHIHSIIERLDCLQVILMNESKILMKNRLRLINVQNANADNWIYVAKILAERGQLTLEQAFFNCESIKFVGKLIYKCGFGITNGNRNRREEYRHQCQQILHMPRSSEEQTVRMLNA